MKHSSTQYTDDIGDVWVDLCEVMLSVGLTSALLGVAVSDWSTFKEFLTTYHGCYLHSVHEPNPADEKLEPRS